MLRFRTNNTKQAKGYRYCSLLTMLIALIACSCGDRALTTPWTKEEISGLTLELIDNDIVEVFSISEKGHAAVTTGTKEAVAAPLLFWQIDSAGSLIIKGDSFYFKLKKISVKNSVIDVIRNDKKARYRIIKD